MKRFFAAIALACVLSVSAWLANYHQRIHCAFAWRLTNRRYIVTCTDGTTSPGDLPTSGFAEQVSDAALTALLSALCLVAYT